MDTKLSPHPRALDRKGGLGKASATLFTAAMILGTGLFVSLGATAWDAGSGVLVAIVIGGLICLSTGISAAQAGINHPIQGGAFIWTRILGYPNLSFVAGCAYIVEGILGLGIVSLGFATYTAQIIPGLSIPLTASLSLIAVAALNILGISPVSKVMIGIFFAVTFFLGVYFLLAIPYIQISNLQPIFGGSLGGVFAGAATFFWTWGGFQRTAIMATDIEEPRTTIPFAIIGGIAIVMVIFVAIAGVTLGILGPAAMGRDDVPLYVAATAVMGVWGAWMILTLATISFFSEMLGDLLATSKVEQTMGQVNELPQWLAVTNARFKSPHFALISLTVIGVVLVCFVPIRQLMPIASAGTLIWYGATNVSALLLPKNQRFAPIIFSWIGISSCIGLFCLLPLWSILSTGILVLILLGLRWIGIRFQVRSVE